MPFCGWALLLGNCGLLLACLRFPSPQWSATTIKVYKMIRVDFLKVGLLGPGWIYKLWPGSVLTSLSSPKGFILCLRSKIFQSLNWWPPPSNSPIWASYNSTTELYSQLFLFWDRIWLSCLGCLWTYDPLTLAFQVAGIICLSHQTLGGSFLLK